MQPEALKTHHEGQKHHVTTRQHDRFIRATHLFDSRRQHAQLHGTF